MPSAPLIPPMISTSSRTSCRSKFQNGIHPADSIARSAIVDRGGVSLQRLTTDSVGSSAAGALGTGCPAAFQFANGRSSQLAGFPCWPAITETASSSRTPMVSANADRHAVTGLSIVCIHSTIVLKPPYAMRFGSKGISGGPPIAAISFITLALTRSRCARDLNTM